MKLLFVYSGKKFIFSGNNKQKIKSMFVDMLVEKNILEIYKFVDTKNPNYKETKVPFLIIDDKNRKIKKIY